MLGKTLWASFLNDKYYSWVHPVKNKLRPGSSTIWKRMLEAWAITEPQIFWLVGRGDIGS